MPELGIDIETYSSNDLTGCGVYKYVEADDFDILLFAYSLDCGPVKVVDLAMGEQLPADILEALGDDRVLKTAYNAPFERICISEWLRRKGDRRRAEKVHNPEVWDCTMVRGLRMGFPAGLASCGAALRLESQKMKEGKELIRFFSSPTKDGRRHRAKDFPEKWAIYKEYNRRDVEVEQQIRRIVTRMDVTETDRQLWIADQRINDRGALVDLQLARNASDMYAQFCAEALEEMRKISGLENPNSAAQVKEWIAARTKTRVSSLNRKDAADLKKSMRYFPDVVRFLDLRGMVAKTSVKKYDAMLDCACKDGRVRGLFQFYGAARTGRWAGRLVQMQNLPQNHLADLDTARELVKNGDLDEMSLYYDNIPRVLSELIRTSFIAKPGTIYHVCDFSAIEARVIAWVAGEKWVLDTFRAGGDIYCSTASQMFGVPVEKHGENSELRPKGKIAVLALGYGGGVSALDAMGGQRMGLTENEEKDIVKKWRKANPKIIRLWELVQEGATKAIETGRTVTINQGITFSRKWGCLIITLPSGRPLVYPRAKTGTEQMEFGEKDIILYEGQNQTTKKWEEVRTYGGKLTENIIQAIARDILGQVILRCEARKIPIVFHVHDEIIAETDPKLHTLQEVESIFSEPIPWANGLPLKGAGYSTPYYLKD